MQQQHSMLRSMRLSMPTQCSPVLQISLPIAKEQQIR
jgi:hypothetical protein